MDIETAERFFLEYLKEHRLTFKKEGKKYVVELDEKHQELYGCEKLICTTDAALAQKENLVHIGIGSFVFDSMIGKHNDQVAISSLTVLRDKNDLMDVN